MANAMRTPEEVAKFRALIDDVRLCHMGSMPKLVSSVAALRSMSDVLGWALGNEDAEIADLQLEFERLQARE